MTLAARGRRHHPWLRIERAVRAVTADRLERGANATADLALEDRVTRDFTEGRSCAHTSRTGASRAPPAAA